MVASRIRATRRVLGYGRYGLSKGRRREALLTCARSRSADLARCLGYLSRHQTEASSDAGRSGLRYAGPGFNIESGRARSSHSPTVKMGSRSMRTLLYPLLAL